MWERLGGYRQRYAPRGAGAEDAEYWLRAGAYGFKAALVEPHASILSEYHKVTKDLKRPPKDDEMGRAYDVKWEAVKASLFNYSWMSGQVTGDSEYREVDWTRWHPWTRDGQHPFASYAKAVETRPSGTRLRQAGGIGHHPGGTGPRDGGDRCAG
jgi:hypothetical protein